VGSQPPATKKKRNALILVLKKAEDRNSGPKDLERKKKSGTRIWRFQALCVLSSHERGKKGTDTESYPLPAHAQPGAGTVTTDWPTAPPPPLPTGVGPETEQCEYAHRAQKPGDTLHHLVQGPQPPRGLGPRGGRVGKGYTLGRLSQNSNVCKLPCIMREIHLGV